MSIDGIAKASIALLFVFLPFEQFVLKFVPVSDTVYTVLYLASEVFVYGLLFFVVSGKLTARHRLSRTPLDLILILFLVVAFLSAVINGSDFVSSIKNIRGLLRYVALYYVVVNIRVDEEFLQRLWRWAIWVLLIQTIIAVLQYLLGESFAEQFHPREIETEMLGQSLLSKDLSNERTDAALGTLGQPGAFSAYLVILAVIVWVRWFDNNYKASRILKNMAVGMMMISVYLTFKRLAFILIAMMPLLVLWHADIKKLKQLLIKYALPISLLLIMTIPYLTSIDVISDKDSRQGSFSFASLIAELFSSDYWAHSMQVSRLWFLTEAFSAIFGGLQFFGFGPDEQLALDQFVRSGAGRSQVLGYVAYKDVYWMALSVYFGIIGLFVFWWIVWRIWSTGLALLRSGQLYGEAYITTLISTVYVFAFFWYSFAERLPILRPNAFFFWMCAAFIVKARAGQLCRSSIGR